MSQAFIDEISNAFADAAQRGVTICIASRDTGSDSKVGDGKAHVQYPATDPWVLSFGGTAIGEVNGSDFKEYVWNDDSGATGSMNPNFWKYQKGVVLQRSVDDGHAGRAVPDVAANASPHSGYRGIYVGGQETVGGGTSASAPLWAGLIAVISWKHHTSYNVTMENVIPKSNEQRENNKIICAQCNQTTSVGKFCSNCGSRLEIYCSKCGHTFVVNVAQKSDDLVRKISLPL